MFIPAESVFAVGERPTRFAALLYRAGGTLAAIACICALAPVSSRGQTLSDGPSATKVAFDDDGKPIGWTLTFHDEFSDTQLNTARWNTRYHWSPNVINNELQAYVPTAFELEDGVLRIRADQTPALGQKYSSGVITTMDKFIQTYGYFEMRAKMPKGTGLWPGFWLMMQSKEWPPEIDIVEYIGSKPDWLALTFHYKDKFGEQKSDPTYYNGQDFSLDFHRYGLMWAPGLLVWYVDGQERKRVVNPNVPSQRMYLLANMAVGGEFPGPPDANTVFPAYYQIDYICAYAATGEPGDAVEPPPRRPPSREGS